MKLLLFSDVHCDLRQCARLAAQAAEVDLVIGAGDFATVRRGLDGVIAVLRRIATPAVLVPGNSESVGELRAACAGWPAATVLHGDGTRLLGREVYGVGGGIPVTPFGSWSYDFTEDEARELLRGCPPGAILITHSPPKDVVDKASSGKHLGSSAIRGAILEKRPVLAVCGHIHESGGRMALLGDTPVVNAGPRGMIHTL